MTNATQETTEIALLAGGCFWGMEEHFRALPGVLDTCTGYTGGHTRQPTYESVCSGSTGHAEAIRLTFDPARTRFEELLAFFFQMHDPCTRNRQGNDHGTQYRSAIFYTSEAQRQAAIACIDAMNASGRWPGEIVTEVVPATRFYPAEAFHQGYLQRFPDGYNCHWLRPDWRID